MITPRSLYPLFLCLGLIASAQAQLATSLRLSKVQYVAGEPVMAVVTITNHAGQDLIFNNSRLPWLDFMIKNGQGNPITTRGRSPFGSMKLGAGQSMARSVDLSSIFQLSDPGNYSVSALIRNPEAGIEGTMTNRVLFNLNPVRPYWTQKVGLAGKPGQTREYRILNFSGDQKTQIYVQILDGRTGLSVSTYSLGEALMVRKPIMTVDRNQHLHVMFLGTPSMWVHCEVDTDGKLVNREIHQRGAQGDPQLMTFADGSVRVGNSILYDPKAAAEAKSKERKASERPAVLYN